jgi:Rps23 Pro-64 3,4-dihydroxylase Tpa1-like proline 4-hydroxylase
MIVYGGVKYKQERYAIYCKKCHHTIESRDIHDFKYCSCGTVGIDGGISGNRLLGNLFFSEDRSMYSALIKNKKIWLPQSIVDMCKNKLFCSSMGEYKEHNTIYHSMISKESLSILEKGYTEIYPFPHVVIENFLEDEYLKKVLEEVRGLDSKDAYYKATRKPNALEYNKFAFKENLGTYTNKLFEYMISEEFVKYIEKLTGIQDILPNDMSLAGAGVHRIHKEGYLAIHTDFNTYTHPVKGKLDRRINLLLYLNPEWLESYKGHLWLCNSKEPVKKILPILNRCVIFNTTSQSFHGHPERLCAPDNIYRESIALYYYTKNTNDPLDFEGRRQHESALIYNNFAYDI